MHPSAENDRRSPMEEQKENINCPALLTKPARQRLSVLQVTKEGATNGHSSTLLIQCFIEEFAFLAKELKRHST